MSKKIIIGLLLSVLIIGQLNLTTFASGQSLTPEFHVDYAQPYCSDYAGYLSVMYWRHGEAYYKLYTYFWNIVPVGYDEYSTNVFTRMNVTITSSGISFEPVVRGLDSYMLTSGYYDVDGNLHLNQIKMLSSSSSYSWYEDYNSCTIDGYQFGGNTIFTLSTTLTSGNSPRITFSGDADAIQMNDYLYQILDHVSNLKLDSSSIRYWVQQIYNEVDNVEEQLSEMKELLDSLIAEQEESNTWLEKIFNFLEEKDEKEKEAATQQGSSSTSQGMDAIEDKGGDFANSLGGLTNSMSYSGTQCAWEFPEVKIPAIRGVIDEVVLIQRQSIDFTQWVNAIPSDILLVVQSICTIGLIVYCFKELYNTIAYVLTLRRDDNE